MNERYFQSLLADELEEMRDEARRTRRISYDCFNCILVKGMIHCRKKHPIWASNLSDLAVLKGRSSSVCQTCVDYDTE